MALLSKNGMHRAVLLLAACGLFRPHLAWGENAILVLKSRDLPQHNEAVAGFLQEWTAHGAVATIQTHTLTDTGDGLAGSPSNAVAHPLAVLAVGTEATRWAIEHTDGPVVFCMVANARQNLLANLDENDQHRLWGVSLNVPVKMQFQEIRELLPEARKIGVIYDPRKSAIAIEDARRAAADLSLDLIERHLDNEAALPEATAWIGPRIDMLWAPLDATVYQGRNAQFVLMQMLQRKVPVFGFSENMVKAGALAAPRVDYKAAGRQTAELLTHVLDGTAAPGGTVQPPNVHDIVVNQRIMRLIGRPIAASPALRISLIDEE